MAAAAAASHGLDGQSGNNALAPLTLRSKGAGKEHGQLQQQSTAFDLVVLLLVTYHQLFLRYEPMRVFPN